MVASLKVTLLVNQLVYLKAVGCLGKGNDHSCQIFALGSLEMVLNINGIDLYLTFEF